MAEIVAAVLASHAPLITGRLEISRPEQRERFHEGLRELRRRLASARPDVLVMFVNDHLQNFPYSNMPAFCVGLADRYVAPSPGGASLMRIPARMVPGEGRWGLALLEAGLAAGIDFAYSYEIESWDELSVPLHFLDPDGAVPIVPIYTNCAAPPLPTLRRCAEVGRFVGDFVRARRGAERVGLVASGGISHWVGTPDTGRINPDFDRRFLEHVTRGDLGPLLELSESEIESEAGNGGQEIRNWAALLACIPGWKGDVLAYEAVPEWITGCGAVWMHA